jgi:predicted house-cleaning noncanonical NTP pyrophosphatase (MazG superfamily)
VKYDKLVRDKIPEIITSRGGTPVIRVAGDSEYYTYLKKKLSEEVAEFQESDTVEELADMLEVVHAIAEHKKMSMADIDKIRQNKKAERGGFSKRIVLEETREL